jgi:CzcA family heavy metal efflux pump
MNILEYLHKHAKALLFTIVVLVVAGAAMMLNLPVSLFPDITFPRIVVLADNGEEPAERMMVEVTKPLEEVATAVPGVQYVRSKTSRGSSEISIGLHWGVDVERTLVLLQGRIGNIRNQLPATASIQAEQMTVAVFPISGYSLTSDSLSQVQLRDIALYQIRPALLRVDGVARVEVTGGDTREYLVNVDPAKLAAFHLGIQQVSDAVEKTNFVASTGLLSDNYKLYLSLVTGMLQTTEDIGKIAVSSKNGVPVHISDVARVEPSAVDQYIRTTAHGRDAVLISVMKQPTGSTVQIGKGVTAALKTLKLPSSVLFENYYDQGEFISGSIGGVRDSIVIGVVLAMLVVWFFLRSWRLMVVVLTVVPMTVAITFLCLGAVGKTINIMTLGGVAAAIGLIIDDSIVIIEHIFSHYVTLKDQSHSPSEFIRSLGSSLRGLMPAVVGSTASTIVIHIPLAFLGGVTGAFFASLSITMVFALLISFGLSVTLAPLMASSLLRSKGVTAPHEGELKATGLSAWYARFMRAVLSKRFAVLPAALILVGLTYFAYTRVGSSFMPEMDEGTFVLDYQAPWGTALSETDRMLRHVEQILLSVPEVESYSRRTGTQLGFFITEPSRGDYLVKLKSARSRSIAEVISDIRGQVHQTEPALMTEFGQMMMDVVGDLTNDPSPIEIKLFSDDAAALRSKAVEVADVITHVPGVVDVFNGIVISGPSLIIRVDPQKSGIAGITTQDVLNQVQNMMQGRVDTKIQKGERLIGVKIRYPKEYREDIRKIEELSIQNGQGKLIPLKTVAHIDRTAGEAEISRDQLQQMVAVTARIEGRDLGTTVSDIQKALKSGVVMPPGMTVSYGGLYQIQQESFVGLVLVSLAAFLLVMIVLLFEFGEFSVPVSIFIVNVISLAGVFLALNLTGGTLNVSSLVGVVMIIGIVAENAVFVFHIVRNERRSEETLDDVLVRALIMRSRPIFMTTLAAVLALLPLSFGIGAGAQMQQPLAIAVIGGFSLSSILLFFVLPPLYSVFHRR